MSAKKLIEKRVTINAPAAKVWKALTDPGFTIQNFGGKYDTDWKEGSVISWCTAAGEPVTTGNILKIIPEKFLQVTIIDPDTEKFYDKSSSFWTLTYMFSEEMELQL